MKIDVQRSIHINASKDAVRALIRDFNHWNSWSPWTVAEPDCPVEVKGQAGQPGHSMQWDGQIIGSGINTLAASDDHSFTYDLQFLKPFKSKAKTSFHLAEKDGGTQVSWTMNSKMPFFLFFMAPMMRTMIGMDYDRGLTMLKAVAEEGKVSASTSNKGTTQLQGFSYVGIERNVSLDEIGEKMGQDFKRVTELVHKYDIEPAQWLSIYTKMDMKNARMTYVAGISDEALQGKDIPADFTRGTVQTGKALEIKHDGPYDFIGNAWSMGSMYLRAKKIKQGGFPFEKYWNHPQDVSPDELQTSIYFPLKG